MLLLVAVFVLFAIWIWRQQKSSKHTEPPLFPGALPLIGHAHLLLGNTTELYKFLQEAGKQCTRLGGVTTAKIGPKVIYAITDPEEFVTVLNACHDKGTYYNFASPWLGNGLITSKGSTWKCHRKLLNPAFNSITLNNFVNVFNKQARRLVKDISVEDGKGPFNQWTYLHHNALETICLTAIGVDYHDDDIPWTEYNDAVENIFNLLIERLQKFWLHYDFIFKYSSLKKKQDKMIQILQNTSEKVLKKTKADYLKNKRTGLGKEGSTTTGTKFKTFMDLLLELSIEEGEFNDTEIREHVDTIIVAGSDTISLSLVYCLLLISSYPQVQEKIYNELREVFGTEDRDVTKFDLSQLIYLEAVLKESMRMYSAGPVIMRSLERDVKLRNYTLSAGSLCFLLIQEIHYHASWGGDKYEFKPERWLDPTTLSTNSSVFAAFSFGKRSCIGKNFSYMSMKITLAHLLRHYNVKGDHSQLKVKVDVLMKPVSGYYISINKRNK